DMVAAVPAPIDPLAPGRSALVSESPFGLSIEYPLLERALGAGPCPPPALVATLRELGAPAIRVGGDSQDLAGPTPTYHYDVPLSFWTALGCLARETGAQIAVGLNFATPSLQGEQTTIARAEQAIPAAQLSFSLGNEPDLYTIAHIIPNEPGFLVPSFRSAPWSAARFFGEWQARRAVLGPIRLEGPDLAGTGWRAATEAALRADPPAQIDAHGYPTVAPCGKSGLSATPAHLLSIHASVGMAEKLSWLARLAHALDRPAVISETNSASCGGRPGVSDAPVSGVWAIRYVIAALLAGFDQVRFHSAGSSYDPLVFGADGSVTMRPLGRALLFLHEWLPTGARIVSISHDPQVLAVKVTSASRLGFILSSFAAKTVRFAVPGGGKIRLAPNRIVAVGIGAHVVNH
ncbi:MAG TPA: hypothetical protein VMS02_03395, partial [Solirubrobacteraceae bacterium]|nr:hypothetical protein [Solirubrobacteraceae bacterium]